MNFADVLAGLEDFCARIRPAIRSVYAKIEVEEPADMEALEAFQGAFGVAPDRHLAATWAVASALRFEWFVKTEGARLAGFDSRLAPAGQFTLLSPQQSIREAEFLKELAGVTDDEFKLQSREWRVGVAAQGPKL